MSDFLLLLVVFAERYGERLFWSAAFYVCCAVVAWLALTH